MIPFIKMHGIGNDFVIIDCRNNSYQIDVPKIAHRRTGIGCDQLVIIEHSDCADCKMLIYNADGTQAGACGNATRCVASLLMEEKNTTILTMFVQNKILQCWRVGDNLVKVDMGKPLLEWYNIPMSENCEITDLPITYKKLYKPTAVNMGNPHLIFFTDDINAIDLDVVGPEYENHLLFPEKVNVNIAQITAGKILLKVWERGVGPTLACGSGGCATMVAAVINKLITSNHTTVVLPGGNLEIEYYSENVFMTGPVSTVFTGKINSDVQ